jgi:hypothetical protein
MQGTGILCVMEVTWHPYKKEFSRELTVNIAYS